MFMHCLNCGGIIHHRSMLPLVSEKKNGSPWPTVEVEIDKFFIRCLHCQARNYLIKEYKPTGASLRLSHLDARAVGEAGRPVLAPAIASENRLEPSASH